MVVSHPDSVTNIRSHGIYFGIVDILNANRHFMSFSDSACFQWMVLKSWLLTPVLNFLNPSEENQNAAQCTDLRFRYLDRADASALYMCTAFLS